MNHFEIIFNNFILKYGYYPFILTIISVLIIILITIFFVYKELKRR